MKILDVTPDDAQKILDIYAPYILETAVTFEYDIPSVEEFRERIVDALKKHVYIMAVDEAGEVLGFTFAHAFRPRRAYDHCVETTIYLNKNNRGQGIGRILYEELERRLKNMGYTHLYACVAIGEDEYLTDASPKFHKAMGYREVGTFTGCGRKFNHTYDMVWFEKIIG